MSHSHTRTPAFAPRHSAASARRRLTHFPFAVCLIALATLTCRAKEASYRLYQGVTIYVNNPSGKAFDVKLEVRDLNLFSKGPREVLFKVYDPDGKTPVREIIPDDGIDGKGFLPRLGGWDHEMWYYALCYSRGSKPMFPWSTYSDPKRLQAMPKRTFTRRIRGGRKGVYRILLVGTRDHYVTVDISRNLKTAVSGNHTWLHGHGSMFRRSYVYVPRGSTRIHLALIEFDPPQTRRFTLTGPDRKVLFNGTAKPGFRQQMIALPKGRYDDKLLALEVSDGPGDYMFHAHFQLSHLKLKLRTASQAVLAPDAATARAVRGGAIYHDGEIFWHPFQVRFHKYLKKLKARDFIVYGKDGEEIKPSKGGKTYGWSSKALSYQGLPAKPGFVPLNGVHEAPPLSDTLMHNYSLHKQRGVLNVVLRDLHNGFMKIGTGDHRTAGSWANLGYIFGTYGYQYWRPAWRVLQQTDAPKEAKAIIREALLLGGDRLSFAVGIERVNGNAFSHIPIALKYCSQATQDRMQLERFKVFFNRFATEAWGVGVGISKSGDCQEHFAHDNHYGSYILANLRAPIADFPNSEFKPISDRLRKLYSYIWCPYGNANPWSARTHHSFGKKEWAGNDLQWLGHPGKPFTVSVNDGDEWFAARRRNYYAVTFHGRLAPMWLVNGFHGQIGFSGGILCQLSVPGKGLVFHSRLKGSYGKGMDLPNWRNFEIHSIVGTMADGRPFVGAVSEHLNTKLTGNVVEGSGEVRDRPIHITRRYTFNTDHILVEAQLAPSGYVPLLTLWSGDRAKKLCSLKEAWEMIPYPLGRSQGPNKVMLYAGGDEQLGELSDKVVTGVRMIDVRRAGYGARLRFDKPMAVKKGGQQTILIRLIDKPTVANQISIKYRIEPYRQ